MKNFKFMLLSFVFITLLILPVSNVLSYVWIAYDEEFDVAYYNESEFISSVPGSFLEVDIVSMELEGSNIILELSANLQANTSCYYYSIYLIWESLAGPDTMSNGNYGDEDHLNEIQTTIESVTGFVDYELQEDVITHSQNKITFPIPLFDQLVSTTPHTYFAQAIYQPSCGLDQYNYKDIINGTFTPTNEISYYIYEVLITGSITGLLLAIFRKKIKR